MNHATAYVWKYWLVAYWLAFAIMITVGGFTPGKEPIPPFKPPYPIAAVGAALATLAAATLILHWLLQTAPTQRWLRALRAATALCYGIFLLGLVFLATGTDLPGYVPALSLFGLCSLAVMFGHRLWRGTVNPAPAPPP